MSDHACPKCERELTSAQVTATESPFAASSSRIGDPAEHPPLTPAHQKPPGSAMVELPPAVAPVELPQLPTVQQAPSLAPSAWLDHIRAYQRMSRPDQTAWFQTLTPGQQAEFNAAWLKLGFNVPVNASVTCPRCGANVQRGEYSAVIIIIAVIVFPIGLLALLAGRNPSACLNCGNRWKV